MVLNHCGNFIYRWLFLLLFFFFRCFQQEGSKVLTFFYFLITVIRLSAKQCVTAQGHFFKPVMHSASTQASTVSVIWKSVHVLFIYFLVRFFLCFSLSEFCLNFLYLCNTKLYLKCLYNRSRSHTWIMFNAYLIFGKVCCCWKWVAGFVNLSQDKTGKEMRQNLTIITLLSCVVLLLCCGEHLHAVWQESPERQAGLTEFAIENTFPVDHSMCSGGILIWGSVMNVIFVLLWTDLWWLKRTILFMRM